MSLATLDRPRTRNSVIAPVSPAQPAAPAFPPVAPAPASAPPRSAPAAAPVEAVEPAPSADIADSQHAAAIRAVPAGTEARGFVLYVGVDEAKALAAGTDLSAIVDQLKRLTAELVPTAETYAAVALAPAGAGGRDVDVVRLALQEPSALARHRQEPEPVEPEPRGGVVVDLSRKRLQIDNETAPLTFKEFELLQYLVLREGKTIARSQLIAGLWSVGDDDVPNERTIDVHVRRLRSKLGAYEDIVRTVRGAGYRFDRHADVSIRHTSTPSPDLF